MRAKPRGKEGVGQTRKHRVNDEITAPKVRLISETGEQLGIKTIQEALATAASQELDLVEVAPQADPPVCRLMDYGKWLYEESQRIREARKHQTHIVIKEMKFRPKIDQHDYETKLKHIERFLSEGAKVKVTVMFRGRELAHPDIGHNLLEKIATDLSDAASVEHQPELDGRNMVMVLAPTKKERKTNA
ncbi:MAG: translation initiation factor IF-3 [Acidimicrobiia bacterium]